MGPRVCVLGGGQKGGQMGGGQIMISTIFYISWVQVIA